ncbi:MAG TPA: hypothetical protein VFL59_14510 [Candidatus Nanopelagicales bacterium]|nr:hypothetical protein [Candidatus Nanopelagicales bacterium]
MAAPAQAINIPVPEDLRWTQVHEGERFTITSITVRLLPDGHLAAKAYGRRENGRTAAYVGLPFEPTPEIEALIDDGIRDAAARWLDHRGFAD